MAEGEQGRWLPSSPSPGPEERGPGWDWVKPGGRKRGRSIEPGPVEPEWSSGGGKTQRGVRCRRTGRNGPERSDRPGRGRSGYWNRRGCWCGEGCGYRRCPHAKEWETGGVVWAKEGGCERTEHEPEVVALKAGAPAIPSAQGRGVHGLTEEVGGLVPRGVGEEAGTDERGRDKNIIYSKWAEGSQYLET